MFRTLKHANEVRSQPLWLAGEDERDWGRRPAMGSGCNSRLWEDLGLLGKAWECTGMLKFSLGSSELWVWWCNSDGFSLLLFAGQSKWDGGGRQGVEVVERVGRLLCQGRWQGMAEELVAGARKDDEVVSGVRW